MKPQTPHTEIIKVWRDVPAELIQPNTVVAEPKTFGDAVDVAFLALGALGQCNRDKAKIRELNNVGND